MQVILQLNRCRRNLRVPEQLHTEYNSPLRRAEVLLKSVADTKLYAQIPSRTGMFETPG